MEETSLERLAMAVWWLLHGEAVPKFYARPAIGVLPVVEQDGIVYLCGNGEIPQCSALSKRQQIAVWSIWHLVHHGEVSVPDIAAQVGASQRKVRAVLEEISRVVPIYNSNGRASRWKIVGCE